MTTYKYYKFYKPFKVISQFTPEIEGQSCLKDYLSVPKDVYPIGRLDFDSEGLLILSNDPKLNQKMLDPNSKLKKTYYVQVENLITEKAISELTKGVNIKLPNKKIYKTMPCHSQILETPNIPERHPPIRFRQNIPTSWLSITLVEGKNHQVRKMCAAVGYPVLRLVRYSIGEWNIDEMEVGDFQEIDL